MPFPSENQPQQLPSFSSFALGNLKLFFFFRFIFAVKHISCESSKKPVNLLVTSPLPHEEFLFRRAVRVIIQCTVSPRGRASYRSRRKPKKYFILRNYNFCIHWDWLRAQHLPGSLQNSIPEGYRHQRSFKQASQSLSAAGDTVLEQPPHYLGTLFFSYEKTPAGPDGRQEGDIYSWGDPRDQSCPLYPKGLKNCAHTSHLSLWVFIHKGVVSYTCFVVHAS